MCRRATRAYYGARALVLIPAMIVLGLALYAYDRLARRLIKLECARNEAEAS